MVTEIRTVGVIGSGTMGAGIAQSAAVSGYRVLLYDLNQEIVERGLVRILDWIEEGVARGKADPAAARAARAAITPTTVLEEAAAADLIIEAIPEDAALKRQAFARLDAAATPHALLASNTSSLSISVLAGATRRPAQVMGLHFFNPAHIMKLVEVVRGDLTADETVETGRAFVESLGKTPVFCRDTPAFIVNRVARPFYGEAFRLLGEQAADASAIDALMRSVGFRMGPFELIDLIGCDVNLAVSQSVYEAFFHDPKYRPHPIQQRMVESGRLGRKTGRGFYDYKGA